MQDKEQSLDDMVLYHWGRCYLGETEEEMVDARAKLKGFIQSLLDKVEKRKDEAHRKEMKDLYYSIKFGNLPDIPEAIDSLLNKSDI